MQLASSKTLARTRVARTPKNILCLAVDRLNADFLGAYGNMQAETSAFDSLAAESILFDSYFTTSLDLDALYRAFWRGESPASFKLDAQNEDESARPSLFRALKEQGYRTFIVSDVESVALCPCVEDDYCDGRFFLGAPDADAPAETLEDAKFFRNFEELARFVAKLEDESTIASPNPWFIWAHFSGMNDVWDFPLDRREKFREDEEDPEPYPSATPPFWKREPNEKERRRSSARLDGNANKDENENCAFNTAALKNYDTNDRRLSVVEAYSGGVATFDETLEGFIQLLKESRVLNKTLFALIGTRGFATGSPSALGELPKDEREPYLAPFYTEETRLPFLFRLPDGTGATLRLQTLCEPRDVFETLRSWNEFVSELASEEFWKLEKIEISPFSGVWLAEPNEEEDENDAKAQNQSFDPQKPDVPGQNLLRLLVDEDGRVRDRVAIVARDADSTEKALVVDDWFLKETPVKPSETEIDAPLQKYELFVRPDDRYAVNDVADRCDETVERLVQALDLIANRSSREDAM